MASKPWLKVGQEWTFRNLHSLMSGLRFFAHDWPKSCEKGCYLPEAVLGLTMRVSCRLPYLVHLYFFVADEEMILLFDFSLSQSLKLHTEPSTGSLLLEIQFGAKITNKFIFCGHYVETKLSSFWTKNGNTSQCVKWTNNTKWLTFGGLLGLLSPSKIT